MEEQLYQDVLAALRAEYGADLLGVLVTGSRVEGSAGPTSDLDVQVLVAGTRRRRVNRVIGGVEIEMFVNSPGWARTYLDRQLTNTVWMFASGRIIYDLQGLLAQIQQDARAVWQAGPPAPELPWRHRYVPADLLRDLEDVGDDDAATANWLIVTLVEQLVASHYALNGRWPDKLKRRLDRLAAWDAPAADLARQALAAGPLAERRVALERLAAHVLAPLGGLMPLEWTTEWEELK